MLLSQLSEPPSLAWSKLPLLSALAFGCAVAGVAYALLHVFGGPNDGQFPGWGKLLVDNKGVLTGTTELPLMDALVDDKRIQYILGLQEVPVMAMADGYAQASRSLGVVNLHISCGLGNGMGMLYNAYRELADCAAYAALTPAKRKVINDIHKRVVAVSKGLEKPAR